MIQSSLQKAQRRLERAKRAILEMERANTFADFSDHWLDFLLASNGVFTQLEAASKPTPQDRQWFGAKKRFRKSEPLLSYLRHARNADEHGVELTIHEHTEMVRIHYFPGTEPELTMGAGAPTFDQPLPDRGVSVQAFDSSGKHRATWLQEKRPALMAVKDDRSETIFDPPMDFMGSPLVVNDPIRVAKVATEYLQDLVAEALARTGR